MTLRTFAKKVRLDQFTCSPVGPPEGVAEFARIFGVAKELSPQHDCYIGTDGVNHYFQQHGNPQYLVVPVAASVKAVLPFRQ